MDVQERELICNYKKCRKIVKTVAYVTACSHVFCDEDGTREFKKSTTCPACQMDLSSKFDIVRNNLQPSEQYKSMILAGLKPEIVIEICSRAISFWLYQCQQEKRYHEYTANKAKDGLNQLEQYYEQTLARTNSELQSTKVQLAEAKKDHEETQKRYNELSARLIERNGQHQKLQTLYDGLRRKFIAISAFDESSQNSGSHCGILALLNEGQESLLNGALSVRCKLYIGMTFCQISYGEIKVKPLRSWTWIKSGEQTGTPANFQHGTPRKLQFTPVTGQFDGPANQAQTKYDIGLGTPRK